MTSPAANLDRNIVYGWIGTVTAVDTTTGVCTVDIGDSDPLDEILYLGPAPKVGAQVTVFAFLNTCVALGGTG